MKVQYFYGQYPWWDDNSLSKPSKTLFMSGWANSNDWTTINNPVIINWDYQSALVQITQQEYPGSTNLYFRLSMDDEHYFYYFEDNIIFDNLTTNGTCTLSLRIDTWGSICANIQQDFNNWTNQVLATNINLNLYEFYSKVATNQSSYMWFKNVYPKFQNIKLVKYGNTQLEYPSNTGYKWDDGNYYYVIHYMVSAYNNTNNANQVEHLSGNLHDINVSYSGGSSPGMCTSNLPYNYITNSSFQPFVSFAPVTTWDQCFSNYSGTYTGAVWTLPFLLSFSTDKDIALIQLPFDLTNLGLETINEYNITGNEFISGNITTTANGQTYTANLVTYTWNGTNYYWPSYYSGNNNSTGGASYTPPTDYMVSVNGVSVWNLTNATTSAGWGSGNAGLFGWGQGTMWAIDNWLFANVWANGLDNTLSWRMGTNWNSYSYSLGLSMLLCPMLINFYSWNVSYMGQTITYNNTYANAIYNTLQVYYKIYNNDYLYSYGAPLNLKFTANYPNLSLNLYCSDNIKQSSTTPIGQINLSTAMLPNTTSAVATFETNEKKIINNSATLKNLDVASAGLNFMSSLGLTSLLNPLSLFSGAINMGFDIEKINLNYSNSFGNAKQYELGHSNTLQTAGDNLGSPDNKLVSFVMVPAVNDVINIMGEVDKYGYLFNQWTSFNKLFGCYYHNYIKLTQNADLLVYTNAPLIIKAWQNYLIQQLINGVVIWQYANEDDSIEFFDTKKWGDCLFNSNAYNNLMWINNNFNQNYHMNFKQGHETNNLVTIPQILTLEQQKTLQPVITSQKEQNLVNQKENPLNKGLTNKGGKLGWKKL